MSGALHNPFAPYTCSVCQAQKQQTNHWFVLIILAGMKRALGIHDWSLGIAQCESAAVACGEKCVHILVSRWFETRGFDMPALRADPAPGLPSAADLDATEAERALATGNLKGAS